MTKLYLEKMKLLFMRQIPFAFWLHALGPLIVVVVLPIPSEKWGHGGTPQRLNSRTMFQSLDQRSKMEEVVPKMACRKRSDAGYSR